MEHGNHEKVVHEMMHSEKEMEDMKKKHQKDMKGKDMKKMDKMDKESM